MGTTENIFCALLKRPLFSPSSLFRLPWNLKSSKNIPKCAYVGHAKSYIYLHLQNERMVSGHPSG